MTPVFALTATITGMISLAVQLFFAWRIKVLTNKTWLVLGSGGEHREAIAVGAFAKFKEPQIKATVILWLGAADVPIAVILVWHL